MNRNQCDPHMNTYPSNNKRKVRKEEAHSPSLLRDTFFSGRGVLALTAVLLVFCMVAGSTLANLGYQSYFIKSDGSLHAMGRNSDGHLGDGTTTDRHSPVQIVSSGVTQVTTAFQHSLFLKTDGSLHAMGYNSNGQLGDGSTTQRKSPVQILASGVTQIAGGRNHSYFVKSDGSLWAMGQNTKGQLGDGSTTNRNSPVQVVASGVAQIEAGYYHSLFLKSDGSLWAMGQNTNGQLGDGTTTQRNSPVQIVASGVTQIAPGGYHSLFLKSDGSLWAMGQNTNGQLGVGDSTNRNSPVQIVSSGVSQIAAGVHGSLFLKSDGSLWAMGKNSYGQLGTGNTTDKNSPVQVVASGVTQIAAGRYHNLFLKSDGSLWGMGYNGYGELGDGTKTQRNSPVQIVSSGVLRLFENVPAAVDDAPVVANALSDLNAAEDAGDATIDLSNVFNDIDDDNASITKAATSSNASLVTATVSGNALTLDFQTNQSGTATITVTGTSNGQTVSDVFTVTVSAVDDAPVVANAIADLSANEDAADVTIVLGNLFNDIDDDNASITKAATSSNASLVTATVSGNVLTLDYQANQSGTATITVTGTSNGQAVSDVFTVSVSPVDDAPVVVNAISDLSAAEDAANATIALDNVFNDIDDDNASITKAATSSNASLVTATVTGNVLTLDFQANQSGTATITVTGTSNGQSVSDAFTGSVSPVDDAPVVVNAIPDLSAAEDAANATIDLGNVFNDIDDDNASITKAATTSNASLVTATVTGNVLTLDFQANQSGTATITVTGTSNGQAVSDVFTVSVSPVDDAPVVVNAISDLSAAEDAANATIALDNVFNDIDDDNASITKAATSSNASLVTATVTGNVLTLDFQANQSGTATITVTGTSNGQSVSDAFTGSVSPVDDAPVVVNAIPDLSAAEDAANATIDLGNVFNDIDDDNASITKAATTSNASLVTATVTGNVLTLDFQANQSGTATITVTGTSNGQAVSDVFTVTVSPVDDAPVVVNAIPDLSAAEDAADATIDLANVFNDIDDDNASITKAATSSDASLFSATVTGNVLTLDYQANQSGTATITVTGTSNGQAVSDVLTVTVSAVDDAPVVANSIADLSAAEDAPDATIALGNLFNDVDDDNASITKAATSSNASLVTATVNGNVLTLAYQANQSGTATITVTGTSNGQAVSDVFTVTVSAVDDAPVVANALADLNAAEDAADVTIVLGNLFKDIDDDNASITKAATSSNASLVTATVNGNTLTLDYQANQSGTATITVTATSNGQAVSDAFTVTVSPVNDAPENLSLSGDEVIENKPAGTIVGNFSATDVDANATLAFSLVDGNGSTDNARFILEANATLKTAGSLDFETGNSLSIRVRVTDNAGSSQEKAFTISVTNVVEDLDGDAIEDAFDDDDDGDGFSDAEEIAYGSDPMDASSVANQAPSGIALDNSDVIENSPAGTKIGDFLFIDPDDINGSGAYVVALVDGNGSTDNNLFAIGTDGSLRTAAVLDFEAKAEHSIRVRVNDEHNASLEAVLAISATNAYAPIVRTLPPAVDGNGTITFGGTVLTDAGSPVLEVGVLTSDNLKFEDAVSLVAAQSANFTVQASALLAGSRYYVRAFATNAEGTTLGAIKRFYTQEAASTPAPWWNDANETAGGWRQSDWFGTFIPYDNGWLYHADLGWLYAIDDGSSGLWLWKKNLGWLWTTPGAFPHLYHNQTQTWLYFLATKEGQPYFYNYTTGDVE